MVGYFKKRWYARVIKRQFCCVLLCLLSISFIGTASAATVTVYTTQATYDAALPASGFASTFEDFSSLAVNTTMSTGAGDVWNGFSVARTGTGVFGNSGYCLALSDPQSSSPTPCVGYNPNAPNVPGIVGSYAATTVPPAAVTFTPVNNIFGFSFEHVDWNDGSFRSEIMVFFSDSTSQTLSGILGGQPGFMGFIVDQAGVSIDRIDWVGVTSELVGIWNVGTDYLLQPPTVAKSFSPDTITAGGTSQLTITLSNSNASAITLVADMDDNLPVGVTVTSVDAGATTCTDAAVDISTNTRVRYNNGASIPAGGCDIVVDVTSSSLGTVTNTILTAALQTDAGSNASPASDNLTVNVGGGGVPICPAGTTLVNLGLGNERNADESAVGTSAGITREAEAYGPIEPLGTDIDGTTGTAALLRNAQPTLVLDLTDIVPENSIIVLSIARNNNPGNFDIDSSIDNTGGSFGGAITFSAGPNDLSQQINYFAPAGGARYIRFDRNFGSIWVDGVEYSQICQPAPEADLTITKTDSIGTYTPGGTATYVITVTNDGPDDVSGAAILDNLPDGVTLSAQWTCSVTAGSSCSALTGGTIGGSVVSLTADIIDTGVITVNVPVQFSPDMSDY